MRGVLTFAPLDLVDLLFYFERLEIVEFGFVRLEFSVELVLAGFFLHSISNLLLQTHNSLRTVSFLSKSTTRPPLSPVAK